MRERSRRSMAATLDVAFPDDDDESEEEEEMSPRCTFPSRRELLQQPQATTLNPKQPCYVRSLMQGRANPLWFPCPPTRPSPRLSLSPSLPLPPSPSLSLPLSLSLSADSPRSMAQLHTPMGGAMPMGGTTATTTMLLGSQRAPTQAMPPAPHLPVAGHDLPRHDDVEIPASPMDAVCHVACQDAEMAIPVTPTQEAASPA